MWLLGSGQHFKAQTQHDTVTCHVKLRELTAVKLTQNLNETPISALIHFWENDRKHTKKKLKCVCLSEQSLSLTVLAAIRECKQTVERNLSSGQGAYRENMLESK